MQIPNWSVVVSFINKEKYYFIFATVVLLLFVGLFYLKAENQLPNTSNPNFDDVFECKSFNISPQVMGKATIPNPEREFYEKYATTEILNEPKSIFEINTSKTSSSTDLDSPRNTIQEGNQIVVDQDKTTQETFLYLPVTTKYSSVRQCGIPVPPTISSYVIGYVRIRLDTNSGEVTDIEPITDASMGMKTLSRGTNNRLLGVTTTNSKPIEGFLEFDPSKADSYRTVFLSTIEDYPSKFSLIYWIYIQPNGDRTFCVLERKTNSIQLFTYSPKVKELQLNDDLKWYLTNDQVYPYFTFSPRYLASWIAKKYSNGAISEFHPSEDVQKLLGNIRKSGVRRNLNTLTPLWKEFFNDQIPKENLSTYIDTVRKDSFDKFLKQRNVKGDILYYSDLRYYPISIPDYPVYENREPVMLKFILKWLKDYFTKFENEMVRLEQAGSISITEETKQRLEEINSNLENLISTVEKFKDTEQIPADLLTKSSSFFKTFKVVLEQLLDKMYKVKDVKMREIQDTDIFVRYYKGLSNPFSLSELYYSTFNRRLEGLPIQVPALSADSKGNIYVQHGMSPEVVVYNQNDKVIKRFYDHADPDLSCLHGVTKNCDKDEAIQKLQVRRSDIVETSRGDFDKKHFETIVVNSDGNLLRIWRFKTGPKTSELMLQVFDNDGNLIANDVPFDGAILPYSGGTTNSFYFSRIIKSKDSSTSGPLKSKESQLGYTILECNLRQTGSM